MMFQIQRLAKVPAFLVSLQRKFNILCDAVEWLTKMQDSEYISLRQTSTGWAPELRIEAVLSAVGFNGQAVEPYYPGDGEGTGGIGTGGTGGGTGSGSGLPPGLQWTLVRFCDEAGVLKYAWFLTTPPVSTPDPEPADPYA